MFHATLRGHLGADPESRSTPTGTFVCNLRLAAPHGFGDKKKTTWVQVAVFGKTAEWAAKNLGKGDEVLVVGDVYNDEWTTRDGEKRLTLKVDANKVEKIGGGKPATNGANHAAADEGGL